MNDDVIWELAQEQDETQDDVIWELAQEQDETQDQWTKFIETIQQGMFRDEVANE